MRLLLDEMHSPSVAESLVAHSFDVVAVAAQPHLRGMPDDELLDWAAKDHRSIVTENVPDYMQLSTEWGVDGRSHAGLILTSPRRYNRAALAYPGNLMAALAEFLTQPPTTGQHWIWWL